MNYSEAIKFLYDLQLFGAKLGLENTRKLAALAGNPQEQLRFIHVAGTNGKGSTCAMLESIYRAAGLRVGLFTSPHLVAFGERIQVDRRLISKAGVVRLVAEMRDLLREFPREAHPTFFEVVTVMALRYFAEQKCELVIWEAGLGGRLDATNIVTPVASVITNIQFDHQKWLGDTLPKIAFEKAGIIKPGVPVITAVDDPSAFRVLFETAKQNHAPFSLITVGQTHPPPLSELELPLIGVHQRVNAAVALHTIRTLASRIPVPESAIRAGLLRVEWPGRLQWVERDGQRLLLDGAHNPGSAEVLRAAVRERFGNAPVTMILGVLRDKDCAAICDILAPLASRILVVPVSSQRAAPTDELAALCREANPAARIDEFVSLAAALAQTADEPRVVLTGSLYLVGEALELLHLISATIPNERKLNEWNALSPDSPYSRG